MGHHILLGNLGRVVSLFMIWSKASNAAFRSSGVPSSSTSLLPFGPDVLFFFMGLFQRRLAPALSMPASSSSRSVGRPTLHQTLRAALLSADLALAQQLLLQ